jgi:hypothetical protein
MLVAFGGENGFWIGTGNFADRDPRLSNGQPDPGCGTTDKRELIFELEIQS